jgi:hypothetical protein
MFKVTSVTPPQGQQNGNNKQLIGNGYADALKTNLIKQENVGSASGTQMNQIQNMRRRRTKLVIGIRAFSTAGAAGSSKQSDLRAVARKTHVYVGRLHSNSTVEAVKAHLQKRASITDVEVIKIDPKSEFQNKYSAYQISCDFDILDKIKDPNILA